MLTNLTTPVEEAEETIAQVTGIVKELDVKRILTILLLLAACIVAMKVLLLLLDRAFRRLDAEKSLCTFVHAAVRVLLWLITICVVLGYMGIEMTSLIAVLSVFGIALSLAIQGSLSNLAGGIQILASKPFKAGDYIEAGPLSGSVVEVGLVYTKLCTPDNKMISIPNGTISGQTIVNYNTQIQRRVDLTFNTSYEDKPGEVIACIKAVAAAHPKALSEPEPFVRLSAYGDSSVEYTVRVWCATEDYWTVYFDVLEQLKTALDKAEVDMTYPHLNVHMMPN